MTAVIWIANIFGWPVIHIVVAKIVIALPIQCFDRDGFFFAPRAWERDGALYRRWLGVRSWKGWLPDGAPWLGGFAKKRLAAHDSRYLSRFIAETRRAEFAHWCTLGCLPFFFLWNPNWACWVMAIYAAAANLPCIAVQRYNRIALTRLRNRAETAVQRADLVAR